MIYILFIVPIITILAGYLMYKYPPKRINYIVGYRTSKSMKNKNNWKRAHKYCGKLWIKIGTFTFIVSLILFVLVTFNVIKLTEIFLTIVTILQIIIIIIITIPFVENRIEKK